MKIIKFDTGYFITDNPKVSSKIESLLLEGSLWEYISALIEKDVCGDGSISIADFSNRFDKLEALLNQMATPAVTVTKVEEPPKPQQKSKPKQRQSKAVQKNSSFFAAAKRAQEFR